jgi:DTW domain-containing protein YfiP
MLPPVETRLAVHVLIHKHEQRKPSSTGGLIVRTVAGAAAHAYERVSRLIPATGLRADALDPSRELWILHPCGERLPAAGGAFDASAEKRPQVLLLDGTWRQAGEMLRSVESMGRCVSLPDPGTAASRFWLREQPGPAQFSTAEALMGVFTAMGERQADQRLRLHFELHVYATLLARGKREMAERYLGHSPLLTEAPEVLDRLHAR